MVSACGKEHMVAVLVCCLFCTNKHGPLLPCTASVLALVAVLNLDEHFDYVLILNFDCRSLNRLLCKHIMHLLFSSRPGLRENALTMDAEQV